MPALVATGDLDEACALADRIGLLDGGQLLQLAPPDELVSRPASRRAAQLIGSSNVIPGVLGLPGPDGLVVETALGSLRAASAPAGFGPGYAVELVIRPDRVRVLASDATPPPGVNVIHGAVVDEFAQQGTHALTIMPHDSDTALHVLVSADEYQRLRLGPGQQRALTIAPQELHVIARS